MKREKGKYVSRSAYQKLAEENKKLKDDIRILVSGSPEMKELVRSKWEKIFTEAVKFNYWLKEIALAVLPNHDH
jgi:hypothetical protein